MIRSRFLCSLFFFSFRKHFTCTHLMLCYENCAHLLLLSFPSLEKKKNKQRNQTKKAKPLAQLPFFVLPGMRWCQVMRRYRLWSTPAILPHHSAVFHRNFPTSHLATECSLPKAHLFLLYIFSIICVGSSCKSHPITLK